MFRLVLACSALLLSSPAWACAGGKCADECGKAAAATTPAATTPAAPVDGTKVVLTVTGMQCGACSSKVSAQLLKTEGVKSATVDHATGKAELVIDSAKTNADALAKVVTDLGYKASVATP